MGVTRLRVEVPIVDEQKSRRRLATELDFTSGLNSWTDADRGADEIDTATNDLFDRLSVPRSDFRRVAYSLGAFHDSVRATRYHQRQFLSRHHIVKAAHAIRQEQGELSPWTNLADRVLVHEFEAYMLRLRSSLDALSRLLSLLLGWDRQVKFGEFCKRLEQADVTSPREAALLKVVSKHTPVLDKFRTIRESIAHDGRSGSFSGIALRTDSHRYPRIEDQEAAEFMIRSWRSHREMLVDFATSLRSAV